MRDSTAPRGARALSVVALLGAIYLGYSPALDGEMQFDDLQAIVNNPGVKDLGRFAALRPDDLLSGSGRALTDLSFALNYRASGLAVRPYHLVNLALHVAAVLAVLGLSLEVLRRLRWPAPFPTALLAAALFGLHPIQSQAVAYVWQRAEVLAGFLYLLGLRFALAGEARGRSPRALACWGLALLCVLLGWGAKPTLATFPAALLLLGLSFPPLDVAPRRAFQNLLLGSLPAWVLTAVASTHLLTGMKGTAQAGFSIPSLTARDYLLTQSRVVLRYARLVAWPAGQNLDPAIALSKSLFEPRTLLSFAAIALALIAAGWLWAWSTRDRGDAGLRALARLAGFGALWFFLLLAPTSSFVPVADVSEEHRLYLASWGLFLPFAAAVSLAARRLALRREVSLALSLALCAVLAFALHERAAVWATSVALWSDVVAKSPDKPRGHMNLGYALTPIDPERAVSEYRRALALADHTINRSELLQDLAGALLSLKRFDESIAVLKELTATADTAALGTNLAIAYLEAGKLPEAEAAALHVSSRWPAYAPAEHTLGQLASLRRDYPAARDHFAKALALDPDATASLTSLAVIQERLGDRSGACRSWMQYGRSGAPHAVEDAQAREAALGCGNR